MTGSGIRDKLVTLCLKQINFLDLEQFLDLYNEQALPSKSRFGIFWFDFWIWEDIRVESERPFSKETHLVSSSRIDLDLIVGWFEIEIFEPWSKLDSNNQITILKHNLYNELVSINGERDRNLWCIIQLGFHGRYYSFISRSKRTLVNPCVVNDWLFERNRCQMAWTDLGHCW